MKIGFGYADVTPRGGKVSLRGQFRLRITDEVLDPLTAAAMVVVSDNARTVWVSADTLRVHAVTTRTALNEVKKLIPDLREEEFILSATHVHTGPTLYNDTYLCLTGNRSEPEEALSSAECNRQFAVQVAAAVAQALENLSDVRMELSVARIQTGVSRRILYSDGSAMLNGSVNTPKFRRTEGRDGGPTQLLYVYGSVDNRLKGVIANVPCAAQCDENADYMTGDYWGVVRARMVQEYGEGTFVFPLCRAAADSSPHQIVDAIPPERNDGLYFGRKCAVWMGNWIADAIVMHKNRAINAYEGDIFHAHASKTVDFPVWQATPEEYEWALQYLADPANTLDDGTPISQFDKSNAVTCVERFRRGDAVYTSRISCVILGDIVFLTSPFELYTEYADRMRALLYDNVVFDVELANDEMGYMPSRDALSHGHYTANIFNCVSGPDGGELLIEESVALAKSLLAR